MNNKTQDIQKALKEQKERLKKLEAFFNAYENLRNLTNKKYGELK